MRLSSFMLLVSLVACAACTRPPPDAPRADPSVRADASLVAVSPVPPARAVVDAGPIVAWTDPGAIEGLARSCAFEPPRDASKPTDPERQDPLSCKLVVHQACIADPCWHEDFQSCRAACGDKCSTCGSACVRECEACKGACRDDACRRACAERCGACRQACLTARDQCATADCTRVHEQCRQKLVESWLSRKCDGVCAAISACHERCDKAGKDDCFELCETKNAAAKACGANSMTCQEMQYAPERKKLDPKWVDNKCDDVCKRIWSCAQTRCQKTGCGELIKEYAVCAARTAGSDACGLRSFNMALCPEPEQSE
jgi:hypothetical protein